MYIDPNKTITVPYSQGNELVFGQNAGQQCVAMSLCSLIYNKKQGINSANDLELIMNIGNQLYSGLSQLTRQSFLMLTELPPMLNVFETDYQIQSWAIGHVKFVKNDQVYLVYTPLSFFFTQIKCPSLLVI